MLETGKQIGNYILVRKLGAGGFGEVWQAEKHTKFSVNNFALKFFRPKEEDKLTLEKEKREIGIWQSVSGMPNVISIIEADQFEDYVYVVSEYADGGSLEKQISERTGRNFSVEETINIALEVLSGLNSLHQMSFVHRDVKPANILIRRGVYCLADFGISREMKAHSKATQTAGTYEYMSPESFENRPVTVHSDIWAVGAIMQQLLTGNLPFPQKEVPSLIYAILHSEPLEIPENVPAELRQIIRKALAKNPQDRFSSAGEMIKALKYQQMLLHNPDLSHSKTTQNFFPPKTGEQTVSFQANSSPYNSDPTVMMTHGSAPTSETPQVTLAPHDFAPSPKPKRSLTLFYILGGAGFLFLLMGVAIAAFVYTNSDIFKSASADNSATSNLNVNSAQRISENNRNTGQKSQNGGETKILQGNEAATGNQIKDNAETPPPSQQATPEINAKSTPRVAQKREAEKTPTRAVVPRQNTPKPPAKKNSDCIFTGDC